jgi:hypothetical protein
VSEQVLYSEAPRVGCLELTIAFSRLAPFIAAGPIMAALAGPASEGAVGGHRRGFDRDGIPQYEDKRCEGRVKNGGILLSVYSDNSDWTKLAKEILKRAGARDISSTGEAESNDTSDRRNSKLFRKESRS